MSERPRSFAWIAGLTGPTPQIIFEDPRTGCAGLPILATRAITPDDPDSLHLLARLYPPPCNGDEGTPLTPPSQG